MKKIVSLLCAGAMLVSLAACGSTADGDAAGANSTAGSIVSTGTTDAVTDADIAAQLADAVTLTFSDSGITADDSVSIRTGMGGMGGSGGQFPGGDGQRPSAPGNGQPPAAPGSIMA